MPTGNNQRRGHAVINEVASLLRNLEFSTVDGATVCGDNIRIVIDPRWDDTANAFRVLLSCYVSGGQKVDWLNMPVRVVAKEGNTAATYVARINQRGQAIIAGLPHGHYRLSVANTYYGGDAETIIYPMGDNRDQTESLAAAGEEDKAMWPEQPATCMSNDARLVATLEALANEHFTLTFETRDKTLENATIRFAIVRTSGEVEFGHEVALIKSKRDDLWVARWEGKVEVQEPANLIFELVSDQ